jgi:hypothetical protein
MFVREDWTLFRTLSTIGQKAGVGVDDLPALVVKELADNAFDACGSCSFGLLDAPRSFYVEDAGGGIPGDDEAVAALFSIARPLTSSKLLRLPTRGALGNGLRVVAGTVLASGGALRVSTRGRTLRLTLQDDGTTRAERVGEYAGPGTRVEVSLGPALQVSESALAYATVTAVFATGGGPAYAGKSSPWWYDSDSFFELSRASGGRSVRDLVSELEGCSGGKAGAVARDFPGRAAASLSREEADQVLRAVRGHAKRVRAERLGYVGRPSSLGSHAYARSAWSFKFDPARGGLAAEVPLLVEAWVQAAEESSLLACVNRTPTTAEVHAWKSKNELHVRGCGLSLRLPAGRRGFDIWLNVTTPYMPVTTDGKEPNLGALREAVADVLTKAVSRAKREAPLLDRLEGKARPKTQKDVIVAALPGASAKASGGGQFRFSIRQLFYAVRPAFLEAFGKEPAYDYFAAVVAEYEADQGCDVPGMYRDTRGTLYHPHTGEEIPLGTLAVEQYRRPEWTFNKILYAEKEGLFPILRGIGWPERHDCALLTSKGFATRAVRDVLDLLGDTSEPLTFFCIHDADGPGTLIYESLQEGTRARGGRRVRIVNLGLEPQEALDMRLQVEPVERKGGRAVPVAAYVDAESAEWLQEHRVELNAMATPEFVAWLDRKLADYDQGKVVPPPEVLAEKLEEGLRARLRERITRAVLHRARIEERAERAFRGREEGLRASLEGIGGRVAAELRQRPKDHWSAAVLREARRLARLRRKSV